MQRVLRKDKIYKNIDNFVGQYNYQEKGNDDHIYIYNDHINHNEILHFLILINNNYKNSIFYLFIYLFLNYLTLLNHNYLITLH